MIRNSNKLNILRNLFYIAILSFTISCVKAEYLSIDPKNPMSLVSSYLISLLKVTGLASSSDTLSLTVISAILYDENGSPLANARMDVNSTSSSLVSRAFTTVYTDSDGMYEISAGDGTLTISVTKSDGTAMGSFFIKVEGEKTPAVTNNNSSFQSTEPQAMKQTVSSTTTSSSTTQKPSITYTSASYTILSGQFTLPLIPKNSGGKISACTVSPSLPIGLNLKPTSCTIAGIPINTASSALYQITAFNSAGSSTVSLSLAVVNPDPPQSLSYSGSPYTFTLGQTVLITPSYSGGKIKSCTSSSSLAAIGLILDPLSCRVFGVASVLQSAVSYTITASNGSGNVTGSLSIGVVNLSDMIVSMPMGLLKTGQTTVYQAGDDGTYQRGIDRNFVAGGTTGLIWQRCSAGQNSDATCSGTAQTYTWDQANSYCSSLSLGGRSWRLPTVNELQSLLLYSINSNPMLNISLFPNSQYDIYWSSLNYNQDNSFAWITYFYGGITTIYSKSIMNYVRCISGLAENKSFRDNINGTITDNLTGLLWQKCNAGLDSNSSNCSTGISNTYKWTDAINYCEGLLLGNRSDWRLPNIFELRSIVDYENYKNPSIDSNYFPNSLSNDYWSSTTVSQNTSFSWYIFFNNGIVNKLSKDLNHYVRCVTNSNISNSAPSNFSYSSNSLSLTVGTQIDSLSPSVTGTVNSYSVSPALPAGLNLNTSTGLISGTPSDISSSIPYIITARNSYGSINYNINIGVYHGTVSMPSGLLKTGQTNVYQTGDDGTYQIQKGIARTFTVGGTTGLVWQRCTRGQSPGDCSGDPINSTYSDAVNYCNNLNLHGLIWRIPNINEISLLIDNSQSAVPLINKSVFPATIPNRYWSKYLDAKFAIAFDLNSTTGVDPNYGFFTRCVSGPEIPTSNVVNNNNGSATDLTTGLIWQKCYGTQNNLDCVNSSTATNWISAISYCENLTIAGRTDWRLPNINELNSILERYNAPTINTTIFPNTQGFNYWTSTTDPLNTNTAITVVFNYGGLVGSHFKTDSHYFRCVAGP
jgi:hypothetical protein